MSMSFSLDLESCLLCFACNSSLIASALLRCIVHSTLAGFINQQHFLDRRAFVSTHSRKGGTPYILTNDATACSMKVVRKQSE